MWWILFGLIWAADWNLIFEKLSLIALLELSPPYSNAGEECVFGMIGENKGAARSSLSVNGTF